MKRRKGATKTGNRTKRCGNDLCTTALLPQHALLISQSSITPEVAQARGYRSATNVDELAELGFSSAQRHIPALVIPIHSARGGVALHQIRPDHPRVDSKGKPVKYEMPQGTHMVIDVPPLAKPKLGDPTTPLFITEGSRKGDSAASRGLCCIVLLGVWNWRGTNDDGGKTALADWEMIALNDRQVYIIFDSDVMTKREVQAALTRLIAFLESRGASVTPLYLPAAENGSKQGLDDFFAAGGTTETLLTLTGPPVRETDQEPALRMSDVGNGERFAREHHDSVRHCYEMKQSLVWNGQRWQRDAGGLVMAKAKQTMRGLDALILAEPDEAKRKVLRKWATESERKHRLEAALFLAQSEPGMAIAMDELDADPWLFNVLNGTLDLRTRTLRPHAREDFITKLAPVEYRPEATCPLFDRLLNRLFGKVPEIRAYLQRIFGYSLTGLTNEQCFFILYGVGCNGKSTILRAVSDLMGDYAAITRPETFLAKRGDDGIRNDIAALAGARFVTSIESEQGKQLAEGLIKGVTGDEKVSARFLHKEYFAFVPQLKLFIGTNHKPTIKGTDKGIWRRVRCVPFVEVIDESERDRSYGEKLRAEFSGILNWLLAGCLAWQREQLGEPPEVLAATEEYRKEQDVLGAFLNDESFCVRGPKATCTKKALYAVYEQWCQENGERYRLTKRNFGKALHELGYVDAPGHHSKKWMGIGIELRSYGADPNDEDA